MNNLVEQQKQRWYSNTCGALRQSIEYTVEHLGAVATASEIQSQKHSLVAVAQLIHDHTGLISNRTEESFKLRQ
jgi:hypothetical protein